MANYWHIPKLDKFITTDNDKTREYVIEEGNKKGVSLKPSDIIMVANLYALPDNKYAVTDKTPEELKTIMLEKGKSTDYVSRVEFIGSSDNHKRFTSIKKQLGKMYSGKDIDKLASKSHEDIQKLVEANKLDQPRADEIKDLISSVRAIDGIVDGSFRESLLTDETGPLYGNTFMGKAISDAQYETESPDRDIGDILLPEYSRRDDLDEGWVSKGIGAIGDVLSIPSRAVRAGAESVVQGKDFAREMSRPSKYKTGSQEFFDLGFSPSGLVNTGAGLAAKGIVKGTGLGNKLAKSTGLISDAAQIAQRATPKAGFLKSIGKEVLKEAPLTALETANQYVKPEDEGGGDIGSTLASLAGGVGGSALQGLGKAGVSRFKTRGGVRPDDIIEGLGGALPTDRIRKAASTMTRKERLKNISSKSDVEDIKRASEVLESTKGRDLTKPTPYKRDLIDERFDQLEATRLSKNLPDVDDPKAIDDFLQDIGKKRLDPTESTNTFDNILKNQKDLNDFIKKNNPQAPDIDYVTPAVIRASAKFKDFKNMMNIPVSNTSKAAKLAWSGFNKSIGKSATQKATIAAVEALQKDFLVSPDLKEKQEYEGKKTRLSKVPISSLSGETSQYQKRWQDYISEQEEKQNKLLGGSNAD